MTFDLDLVAVDPENLVSDFVDEVSYEFDDFCSFEKQIQKFDEELKISEKESRFLLFFYTLHYLLSFAQEKGRF